MRESDCLPVDLEARKSSSGEQDGAYNVKRALCEIDNDAFLVPLEDVQHDESSSEALVDGYNSCSLRPSGGICVWRVHVRG
jgi:hypothetical protein